MLRGGVWVQESDGLGEETPPQSLSFCHQAAEALTRLQQSEKTVTRVIWVLDDLSTSKYTSMDFVPGAHVLLVKFFHFNKAL